ncbi:hypothetical protein M422DRAFT_269599 [Sphaerobolus stellatus SS14]|uniref:Uncharacterized protein n=1 Tax=Sphaerobolus stellatus (strain SS14) TaxID=990650 RepID=A0A0C9UV66_SPHS4|nr:hypothetical protein M422DRAFT_269599 [Sphaerobolus stellatus SS14]
MTKPQAHIDTSTSTLNAKELHKHLLQTNSPIPHPWTIPPTEPWGRNDKIKSFPAADKRAARQYPAAAGSHPSMQHKQERWRGLSSHTQAHPYISDDDYDDLRTRATTLRESEEHKSAIPDMVPGFQASLLTHGAILCLSVSRSIGMAVASTLQGRYLFGVPAKVIRAFRAFEYVPYIALTASARTKAEKDEQEMELWADGTFMVKKFDRQDEQSIREGAWQPAARDPTLTIGEGRAKLPMSPMCLTPCEAVQGHL